jgi:hypothetical protein
VRDRVNVDSVNPVTSLKTVGAVPWADLLISPDSVLVDWLQFDRLVKTATELRCGCANVIVEIALLFAALILEETKLVLADA